MSTWTGHQDFSAWARDAPWGAARRAFGRTALAVRLPLALTGGLLGAVAVLARMPSERPAPPLSHAASVAWTREAEASPRFALKAPALAALPLRQEVWTREAGGRRETEYRAIVGAPNGDGPFVTVVAARNADPHASLFLASVRGAANAGLAVARFGRVAEHRGRFGTAETASVFLSGGRGPARDCVAWRSRDAEEIGWSGFLCPAADGRVEGAEVECLLRDLGPAQDSDLDILLALQGAAPTMPACASFEAALTRNFSAPRVPGLRS